MITVVGFPRSGTYFLHRMLAHYVDGPGTFPWHGEKVHTQVRKIHWAYQRSEDDREVYIYRDPRDCALSGHEYVERSFAPGIDLMTFLKTYFSGGRDLWPTGWREHVSYWLRQGIPALSYEALCRNRAEKLGKLVVSLGLDLEDDRLVWAEEKSYCFGEHRTGGRYEGRKAKDRAKMEGRYEGRAGRWRAEMDSEALQWMDGYCGELMVELGYLKQEDLADRGMA